MPRGPGYELRLNAVKVLVAAVKALDDTSRLIFLDELLGIPEGRRGAHDMSVELRVRTERVARKKTESPKETKAPKPEGAPRLARRRRRRLEANGEPPPFPRQFNRKKQSEQEEETIRAFGGPKLTKLARGVSRREEA